MREEETFDLLGDIDQSLKESIDALGEELRDFLRRSGEKFPEDVKKEEKEKAAMKKRLEEMKGVADPFISVFRGFKEIFGALLPTVKKKETGKPSSWALAKERKAAAGAMGGVLWNAYKNFKKAHRMITW
ncbi:TPA: hypothetical protein HA265_08150 [Candidatus Woesearchaeota archaeon]|nr:hypothetical protein [Candidatus Woesearchaeota archaeon]